MSPLYIVCYFKTPEGQHKLLANTSSTGVPSISRPVSNLRQIELVVPPPAVLDAFEAVVGLAFRTIASNDEQSRTLAATRDLLLPKLMSGEIRIRDAEKTVEAIS
jgi:type I restriction enzyme S subunit